MKTLRQARAWVAASVIAAIAAAGTAQAAGADAALIEAARKEGQVVWYSTLIVNQITRPLALAFEKKYPGIKVQYSRATSTDVALKITSEARAGRIQADVFDGSNTVFPLGDAGLVESYQVESARPYPPELRDANGTWTALNVYFMTAGYNTDLVKGADIPKSFDDLLNPKWAGKMAWTTDPTVNGPPGFIQNILALKGEAPGMAYLKSLAAQKIVNIPASQRVVLDKVIAGEFPIGLMIFNHHAAISAEQGAPVAWARLEPLVSNANLISTVKGAPHPNAAKLFLEYVLSIEGQKEVAKSLYLPAHPQVQAQVPDLKPEAGAFKARIVTPDMLRAGEKGWTAIYQDLFR
jgi:iron(III) transport system substrate-binding protein